MKPIYLDYAATTPLDPRVLNKMQMCLTQDGIFGNAASLHFYGNAAKEIIEEARTQVASLIHAEPSQIIWTSGATEANNLALKGAAHLYQRKGKHIITFKTEHKSVLDCYQHLEKEGYVVSYLSPQKNGLVDMETFEAALRPDTILVSLMHVNNETGVIQDLKKIADITYARGILFHVDAAQSMGKVEMNINEIPADLISLCAHKLYGPKGIGALYLRKKPRVRVAPRIHGGGHEQGMRSGTLATHQIAGMGEAFKIAEKETSQDFEKMVILRDKLWKSLEKISYCKLNIDLNKVVPHILNVRFDGLLAEALLEKLPQLALSSVSACEGKSTEGSHVLRAMGLTQEGAKSAIRISLGEWTTKKEIEEVIHLFQELFKKFQ